MSGIVNFNAQVAPMEHVEKVVRQEQEHGQIKQEALMHSAAQTLGRDNEQVQKTAATKKDRRVERRTSSNKNGGQGADFSGKDRGAEGQADDESLAESAQTGIWSGNIVNLKV